MKDARGLLASAPCASLGHSDETPWPSRTPFLDADFAARAVIVALFTMMTVRLWNGFLATGHLTGLLLVASELLVVVLTVFRRAAVFVDRAWRARLLTGLSMAGPPLVVPVAGGGLVSDGVTVALSAAGLLVVVGGKLSLGRSFGLLPANRGIVSRGLYRVVRHPIYLGYLVTHAAFLVANPSVGNAAALMGADAALLLRAREEERTLVRDQEYAAYCTRVRWKVLPGIY
jgi:protein-S-isoprenylcysteine O-methyltransferase Ste14